MDSFGLEMESISVTEKESGRIHIIKTDKNVATDDKKGFDALSPEDKEKVDQILFLLDRFCIGDSFCHELTMTVEGLPKSYLVKQRRKQLNDISHVVPIPGISDGAHIAFTDMLQSRIREFVKVNTQVDWTKEKIQLKISGDGAKMSRNSNFVLLSFSLLQSRKDVMSAKGTHTFAIYKGSESYDTMKTLLRQFLMK